MVQQVVEWIGANLWTIIIIISIFIQITPIKISPWTALFKWIGKQVTGNTCSKIDGLIDKVGRIESDVKTNEKDRIRW
jgi:cobalamin biosynthesis protein CobD/CbiB